MSTEITDYRRLFDEVLQVIKKTQIKAYKSLTKHQLSLNFEIGKLIVESQEKQGWGKGVVEDLSKDINKVIDGVKGYSSQNLWRMRSFYLEYKDTPNLLKLALQVPWSQNLLIISKVSEEREREYYLEATINLGWSRVLLNQIKGNAYGHHIGNEKHHNFQLALPEYLVEQAEEALKSEYTLDFLGLTAPVTERALENQMIENIRDLLMEMGFGFCFITDKEQWFDNGIICKEVTLGNAIADYRGKRIEINRTINWLPLIEWQVANKEYFNLMVYGQPLNANYNQIDKEFYLDIEKQWGDSIHYWSDTIRLEE